LQKLIVNADDFGLSPAINRGIIKAHDIGIVTAASLAVTGNSFPDAVRSIKEHPSLDVGIHFTLTDERPLLPVSRIPSLVGEQGKFRKNITAFYLDYMRGNISSEEITLELFAQAEKVLDHGIQITHADSHQHVHILPGILKIVLRICRKFRIHHLRRPSERIHLGNMVPLYRIPRFVQQIVLNAYCRAPGPLLVPEFTMDNFYGFYDGGSLSKDRLLGIIDGIGRGTSELMCHPAENDPSDSCEKHSSWNYRGDLELACLIDEEIRNRLLLKNIQLISFRDL
jgi:predicted glycoside hydrolase/deacetylase ChbG (UPF0249 family)